MPTTRKRVIKTVYKDDDDSEQENEGHDYSDSGSDAEIPEHPSSDEEEEGQISSDEDFKSSKSSTKTKRTSTARKVNKTNLTKSLIKKLNNQQESEENSDAVSALFTVKDLTAADKLLPPVLNLSESDSSDDESPRIPTKTVAQNLVSQKAKDTDDESDSNVEYKDVWSNNIKESEEVAKRTFLELEQHKNKIEEAKMSIQNYTVKMETQTDADVKDLLALGEEEILQPSVSSQLIKRKKKVKDDSDSEMEDWEEVNDAKPIPQQGLQLIVDIPNAVCRKTKKLDVEMMMKRKINRVKKEYQVYMHKVHVLCWLAHGNYVSRVLNDQSILAAALSLVPSKECYPGERVDMKYVEQITTWFKDKVTLKQDKHENKYRPKAPPLTEILQKQIKSRIFTTKKYIVFVFVSMLRSLGLQCRVMFNFVTLPIRPPISELCSLSTKPKDDKSADKKESKSTDKGKKASSCKSPKVIKEKIPQLDGNYDMSCSSDSDNIMQVDGNDDGLESKTKKQRNTQNSKKHSSNETNLDQGSVSPPKRARRACRTQPGEDDSKNKKSTQKSPNKLNESENKDIKSKTETNKPRKSLSLNRIETKKSLAEPKVQKMSKSTENLVEQVATSRRTRSRKPPESATLPKPKAQTKENINMAASKKASVKVPKITVTNENDKVSSEYFANEESTKESAPVCRKRSKTSEPVASQNNKEKVTEKKVRARSAQNNTKSKYFADDIDKEAPKKTRTIKKQIEDPSEDTKRVSHKDLLKKTKVKNDVTDDLIHIIKGRVKEAKQESKKLMVKGKIKKESDEDSDYLPVESPKIKSESDDDFKPSKISPKSRVKTVKKVDRRVMSTDDENQNNPNKIDVWCEVFVEELEEWIAVDVVKGSVHCVNELYGRATHPVTYVVGWDNNNYLKDLTRKYVPHWNTVTRKQRVEPQWWDTALKPWLGPKTARDREEDERLDQMQMEAPLPKAIGEYKNHPLYALKRHLLKFEAIYPPDAATLGFVRGEPVYARDCVYVCRSRDTWLKEAKVVKLGEQPYKVVKARPKWDRLSNKLITDKPLEVFGPWQVQDYEPPTAENGVVPRNAYGNVELFKDCMLPKGTVHLKLPGLNRVAKKLNIDCAPAMTGFDFNGGWSHPVYDGFVVCEEFEEIITEAWIKDQEDQERKEQEKIEARVYGNWRRLIRGLLIKERLKAKYGFEEPSTSQEKKKKGPRLVVKKK